MHTASLQFGSLSGVPISGIATLLHVPGRGNEDAARSGYFVEHYDGHHQCGASQLSLLA
jgi:hypothetical protein